MRHLTIIVLAMLAAGGRLASADQPSAPPKSAEIASAHKADQRRRFQTQELTTAKAWSWIFNPGEAPRIVWRDPEEVRRLGGDAGLKVRWFDAKLNEAAVPRTPGRWGAWIEGTAPNGTPLRRSLTFFARPKNFLIYYAPELSVRLPFIPGPIGAEVWREHEAELSRLSTHLLTRAINDSEEGAILLTGLSESKPLGRPAGTLDLASVFNADYHLALKLKVQGLKDKVRPLAPPRRRATPATALGEGSLEQAGMKADARQTIDAVCRAWAEDTGEPFVTLVARRGVIVLHGAYGRDKAGTPIGRDYRCEVASITKTVTALVFSRFLDQGLLDLDDSLSAVFPDYPRGDPHVPTFRQCFNHTSGLAGHGEHGGARHPHLENIVLNGIDVNQPNVKYAYSGTGFELAAKAMEIVAGRNFVRLYDDGLFRPLGFGDVPLEGASFGARFTAMELGVLAQWVANRGSYAALEFIRPSTFERLLPEPLRVPEHGFVADEGIGMHWIRHVKPGADQHSRRREDLLFSPRTLGHGSLTGCVFLIDPDQQLVVTQARRQSGPRSAQWSPRFFQAIAAAVNH